MFMREYHREILVAGAFGRQRVLASSQLDVAAYGRTNLLTSNLRSTCCCELKLVARC